MAKIRRRFPSVSGRPPVVFNSGHDVELNGILYRIGTSDRAWFIEPIGTGSKPIKIAHFFPFFPGKVNLAESFNHQFTYGQLLVRCALQHQACEPYKAGQSPLLCEACNG